LSIRRSLTLIPAIALLFILGFGIQIILINFQNARASDRNMALVNLANMIDDVAHNTAVERGLSAGYIGSGNPTKL